MGIILTDLVARTLQRVSPGQAATAIDGTVRGVFVSRYHSCQSSYLMDVTSGEGHTPGQLDSTCCDMCKCLHLPVGRLYVQLSEWF